MSRALDSWDDTPSRSAPPFASSSSSSKKTKISIVRDDWEMDDDDEDDTAPAIAPEEENRRIWEDANTKLQHPMPKVVLSRGTSASITSPSLPLNLPPAMRILKRPSASPSQPKPSAATGETFQEREARYQAARERIFGATIPDAKDTGKSTGNNVSGSTSLSPGPQSSPGVKVIRDPRGPLNQSSSPSDSRGFGERRQQPPPTNTSTSTDQEARPVTTNTSDIPS